MCVRHPQVGVPVLIAVIVFSVLSGKKGKQAYRGRVIRRGNDVMDGARQAEAIARLTADDPGFDQEAFCNRVATAFRKIQAAWSEQNIEPVRAFISDGIFERFSLQIQEQRDLGYRNRMENVVVHQTLVAQVESDELFDTISVRIRASALDYRERIPEGNRIGGTTRTEEFVEYWTFLRRRGVKTEPEKPGLIEGNCPNCGTDIELNSTAKCPSCESLLRSGQYDWVLVEITQDCEWVVAEQVEIAGVDAFRQQRDPGFNVQHLEDRASVAFWRKVMADRLGNADPLAKMATAEFCEKYAETFKPRDGQRPYYGDCAVGSVETLGVLPGTPKDRALVEVRWSGKRFFTDGTGPPKPTDQGSLFRHVFVLGRNSGVASDVGQAVSSAHCPSCGAPETQLASHTCEFCGEVLSDGSHDWVLLGIHTRSGDTARGLLQQALQAATSATATPAPAARPVAPGGTQLLAWAIHLALADNELDPKERAMLGRVARHRGIRPEQLETMIEAAQDDQVDLPEPEDADEAQRWLEAMADVALADGRIHRSEANLLMQAGQRLNWSQVDVKLLLKRRHTQLYQAARQRLAQQKQGSAGAV